MGPTTTARVTNRSASVLAPRHHGTDESVIAAASEPAPAVPVEASGAPSAALAVGSPCPLAAASGAPTAALAVPVETTTALRASASSAAITSS